jgi:hypothetical protein
MLRNILLIHIADNLILVSLPDVYQHVGVGILGKLERCIVEPWYNSVPLINLPCRSEAKIELPIKNSHHQPFFYSLGIT